jgi:hypothetical protein
VETNLSVDYHYKFPAAFVLSHRYPPSRSTEDVGDDYGTVRIALRDLFLFVPIDYIAGCIDVGVMEELQSGLDLDSTSIGENM